MDHRLLEGHRLPRGCAPTCQPNDIQRGATHVGGDVQLDNIRIALVQFGDPAAMHFGSLLIEDRNEGLDLCRPEGRVLRGAVNRLL